MRKSDFWIIVCWLVLWPAATRAEEVASKSATPRESAAVVARETDRVLGETVRLYQWFHANPELSEQEADTAKRMAQELRAIGLEVHEGIGGHGVIGILRGTRSPSGPVVLYRADMDALPITEKTGLSYASKRPGVMHACGHDVHMATALGTLRVLATLKAQWRGAVLFVAQPAEEVGKGARSMLADPAFQRILRQIGKPKVALALHDSSDLPAGSVAIVPGFVNANVDSIDIVVHGKGGHGARPHETVDPIVIGAEIVLSLQTIVSRRIVPGEKAVISVGMFQAGSKHNIIPSDATLLLTTRSYTEETRTFLMREIQRVAQEIASAHAAPKPPTIQVRDEHTPAAYNDPAWAARLEALFVALLGKDKVEREVPAMGGEDFGRYARELGIPGVMWRIGGVSPRAFRTAKKQALPGLHSDRWTPDVDPTLRTGILTASMALLDALGSP